MFRASIRLPFRLLGIPVLLDLTFLLALPLLTWMIGVQVRNLSFQHGLWLDEGLMPWLLGLVITLGLFASVVIHELGHALAGRWYGVHARSITLWLLGGMAQFDEMPRQRGGEAVVAVAGPVTSLLVAAALFGATRLIPIDSVPLWFTLVYLWQMNLVLAIFNLLPALPLDGGRILRSLLALRLPHARATRFSGMISKIIAAALLVLGVLYSPFLILVAVFVWWATSREMEQSEVSGALDGLHVRDLMTPQPAPLQEPGEPVIDGLDTASEALTRMRRNNTARLLVTDGAGRIIGTITRTDLSQAIQMRLLGLDDRSQAA